MQHHPDPQHINLKLTWPIILIGASLGLVLAWSVLSGDQQGRVNLFYLLLVYLFLPLASLVISCLSLLNGKGINLSRIIATLPIWSDQRKLIIRKAQQLKVEKFWFFYHSQLAALAFSASSLLIFFMLLIASDINFVWRSTLLSASDIYPLLNLLATPWAFWPEAQPSLTLLEATQDSRLQAVIAGNHYHAQWWKFVLAVQVFYCVILRSTLLLLTTLWFKYRLKNDIEQTLANAPKNHPSTQEGSDKFNTTNLNLPQGLTVNNWAGIEPQLLLSLHTLDLSPDNIMKAGPLASEAQHRDAERWLGKQIVLVKSWEPPLGELEDFLKNGNGFIFPLDWKNTTLKRLRPEHLQEWLRFVNKLPRWQVYLPNELLPAESK